MRPTKISVRGPGALPLDPLSIPRVPELLANKGEKRVKLKGWPSKQPEGGGRG